ncbi:MAG TPA: hypothetical protein VNA69_21650 [Thermoanaerobaculia bacterium]|nr:hypothetical protein [Thermoanaerobaculia bacterium]
MNNIAQTRMLRLRSAQATRLEGALSASYVLPGMLALNTVALLALDRLGGIPQWIKTAAALFLAF